MLLHVLDAGYLHDYVIRLRFSDGVEGEVDLQGDLRGEMFEPLLDVEKFKRFRVDPEMRTVVWDNGADLAPEFLYAKIKVPA